MGIIVLILNQAWNKLRGVALFEELSIGLDGGLLIVIFGVFTFSDPVSPSFSFMLSFLLQNLGSHLIQLFLVFLGVRSDLDNCPSFNMKLNFIPVLPV